MLTYADTPRSTGDAVIKHQIEVFLHTDSKTAAWRPRCSATAPRGWPPRGRSSCSCSSPAIAKYAHDKPEKARGLLTADGGR